MILLILDRDGTLIEDKGYLGRNDNWKEEIFLKQSVVDLVKQFQKEENDTIVVSNQAGVAKGYFDCRRVEEINSYLEQLLNSKGVTVKGWYYCPDVDDKYANSKGIENFLPEYVKEFTRRKPSIKMVQEYLLKVNKRIEEYHRVIVVGDSRDDLYLAQNLKADFIDASQL